MIPITRPDFDSREAEAVAAVLRSGWVTQGPKVAEFERVVADYCGAAEAVAVSSGTAALHLALLALGVGPGDEVVCPSMSFIATANSIRLAGATPVFADVDPETYNLDPDAAESLLSPRTKAVLVVHQLGMPADLDRFLALGHRRGIAILEDAACALGSRYRGKPIGGHAEMACFSFHPRKVITTGEGGMITTNRPDLARRLRQLRNHGMSRPTAPPAPAGYDSLGYNYRMSDLHAAMGLEQMKKLDRLVARRRELASRYRAALADHPWLRCPWVPHYAEPNYQSFADHLTGEAPINRDAFMWHLLDAEIACGPGVMLAHREVSHCHNPGTDHLPKSEMAHARSAIIPLYPQMTDEEFDHVVRTIWSARDVVMP